MSPSRPNRFPIPNLRALQFGQAAAVAALLAVGVAARAETLTLLPIADAGLFGFAPDNNLGGSTAIQIGTNGQGTFGRGLFRFDIAAAVPPGARIDAVSATFEVIAAGTGSAPQPHDLYRVQLDWQEGDRSGNQGQAAGAGQTTWDARFHESAQWTVPGGAPGSDFAPTPSASATLAGVGRYTFASVPDLVRDVQGWLDQPGQNFGWALISQGEATSNSTRRIATRESPASAPRLTIEFTPFRITKITPTGEQLRVEWQGGSPPFLIEQAASPDAGGWMPVATTSASSALVATPPAARFFRVREAAAAGSARYVLSWTATWSSATHPSEFPPGAHFTPLIGASHDRSVTLWQPGALATQGIKDMAERGSNAQLRSEIQSAIVGGGGQHLLEGNSLASPGTSELTFDISTSHPLVTLATMIAPSPDWFIGVHGLALFDDDRWLDQVTVALQAYDAGTDSGTSYAAANLPTAPPAPVSPISPGGETRPLGTFTFRRIE